MCSDCEAYGLKKHGFTRPDYLRVATGQGKVRGIQGQGKVREFCNWSGKFGILRKVREFWNWSGTFDFLMFYAQ